MWIKKTFFEKLNYSLHFLLENKNQDYSIYELLDFNNFKSKKYQTLAESLRTLYEKHKTLLDQEKQEKNKLNQLVEQKEKEKYKLDFLLKHEKKNVEYLKQQQTEILTFNTKTSEQLVQMSNYNNQLLDIQKEEEYENKILKKQVNSLEKSNKELLAKNKNLFEQHKKYQKKLQILENSNTNIWIKTLLLEEEYLERISEKLKKSIHLTLSQEQIEQFEHFNDTYAILLTYEFESFQYISDLFLQDKNLLLKAEYELDFNQLEQSKSLPKFLVIDETFPEEKVKEFCRKWNMSTITSNIPICMFSDQIWNQHIASLGIHYVFPKLLHKGDLEKVESILQLYPTLQKRNILIVHPETFELTELKQTFQKIGGHLFFISQNNKDIFQEDISKNIFSKHTHLQWSGIFYCVDFNSKQENIQSQLEVLKASFPNTPIASYQKQTENILPKIDSTDETTFYETINNSDVLLQTVYLFELYLKNKNIDASYKTCKQGILKKEPIKKSFLFVTDNTQNTLLFRKLLSEENIQLTISEIINNDIDNIFDCILIYETQQENFANNTLLSFRKDNKEKKIPIYLIKPMLYPNERSFLLLSGCDEVLCSSIKSETLVHLISLLF